MKFDVIGVNFGFILLPSPSISVQEFREAKERPDDLIAATST
jgi:hypothetical protein